MGPYRTRGALVLVVNACPTVGGTSRAESSIPEVSICTSSALGGVLKEVSTSFATFVA